jgi:hypothetical protein
MSFDLIYSKLHEEKKKKKRKKEKLYMGGQSMQSSKYKVKKAKIIRK